MTAAALQARYDARIAAGAIEADPAQADVVARLARLEARLAERRPARGWLVRLFGGGRSGGGDGEAPRGLYIHGDVGRGKTMLMDLFFTASAVPHRRRAHFHDFMADAHERVHQVRQRQKAGELAQGDPTLLVGDAIATEATLLCFDEFHVTDIADAMILGRLFQRLFERGVTIVATSNVPPSDLYKGGLNRELFLPFIAMIEEHMDVVRLAAPKDFRLEKLAGAPAWYVPADRGADAALDAAWRKLTAGTPGSAVTLAVKGRGVVVPRAAMGVARFTFDDLCVAPLAAIDYLRIVRDFHTLLIDRIPVMNYDRRNHAKRFIILVDTLYEHAVKLVASADAEPAGLYRADTGFEAREFSRTVSRLIEMRSDAYLALPHGGHSAVTGSTEGLVET